MRNPQIKTLITIILLTITTLILKITSQSQEITVHQLLEQKGLPKGLLPKQVKSYKYNDQNGLLIVHLDSPCLTNYKHDNRVKFDKIIRANLSFGELLSVEGLTQEELFIWLPIKLISVNDINNGVILFDIGMALKHLSLSLFEDPPTCHSFGEGNINYNGQKDEGFEAER